MFRFVTDSVGGVGAKRKQHPQRSCDTCKKRHKRCSHTASADSDKVSASPQHSRHSESPEAGSSHRQQKLGADSLKSLDTLESRKGDDLSRSRYGETQVTKPASITPRYLSKDTHLRFVGDLSPEASFLGSRSQRASNRNTSRHEYVGVWLGQKPNEAVQIGEGEQADGRPGVNQALTLPSLEALRPSLIRECISIIPPEYEYRLLADLFYAKFDPLFPIVQDEDLSRHGPTEAAALKQCICLVAALDPSLRRHLRLPHTEHVLSQLEFRDRLAVAVKHSLDMGYITDKVVMLQVCALMTFYVDKPGCSEISSYYCSQAVHLAQGLGLHLGWPGDSAELAKSQRIFWCVWILDRLNAASNGRPILYHERDIDQSILLSAQSQAPTLKLLIRITQFLDETISFYRPHAEFPGEDAARSGITFEDMVDGAGALEIGGSFLASLEMFYLSVVILRSRPNGPKGINRTPSSEFQVYCATHIVSIATEEFKSSVTFWPIMPYAIAMATSVAYKTLRNSMIPSNRKRAYALFHSSCEVLDELSKAFLSAITVARLATETVQEVERLAGRRRIQAVESSTVRRGSTHSNSQAENTQQSSATSSRAANQEIPPTSPTLPLSNEVVSPPYHFDGDAGIFTDFDPNFDLGRLDAVFSANLDPTMPMFSDDWGMLNPFG